MRLEPCGDVAATGSERIYHLFVTIEDARQYGAFRASKASLINFITSLLGRINFPHIPISVPSNTWRRHDGHWIEEFFKSISSTLPISKIARLDASLNTMLSLFRSSRTQILFEPIFTLAISWVFALFFKSASVTTSCSLRCVPTSSFEAVRSLFSSGHFHFHFCRVFRFVSHSRPALPGRYLFTPSLGVGCCCCCCCTSQLLFSVTLGAGLGVASLSENTRSPFWEIFRWMQSPGTVSRVMIANDFVCQNCNPWSCALDNLYPIYCILIVFPTSFCNVLSEEQCNHHEVFLHLVCFRTDAEVYGLRIFLWLIGLVNYIGHPQPPQLNWARVYCGCQPGPTRVCGPPSRQDDGGTRAPALHTLDDVLRFRGDEEYRAVLLQEVLNKLLVELCRSFFPPGISPLPKIDWEFHEDLLWRTYSFQLYGNKCVFSIISGFYWNTTRVSLNRS